MTTLFLSYCRHEANPNDRLKEKTKSLFGSNLYYKQDTKLEE